MAVTTDQQTIEIRDMKTGELARTIQPGGLVYTAAFSPDGRNLAVGLSNNWVAEVYDLETESPPLVFSGFQTAAPVYSIQYSADGKELIWTARGSVQTMDLETGEFSMELAHEDSVQSLASAPNGALLATAAAGTINIEFVPMINLWTPAEGMPLGVLLPGEAVPAALTFSPDASLLAAGSGNTIQVYDTTSQTLLAQFEGGGDAVTGLAFSPDGISLVSTTADGSITLWQVVP
jgi:WD40 repeat protein